MPGYDLILYFECGCTEHRHETSCPIQEHFQFEIGTVPGYWCISLGKFYLPIHKANRACVQLKSLPFSQFEISVKSPVKVDNSKTKKVYVKTELPMYGETSIGYTIKELENDLGRFEPCKARNIEVGSYANQAIKSHQLEFTPFKLTVKEVRLVSVGDKDIASVIERVKTFPTLWRMKLEASKDGYVINKPRPPTPDLPPPQNRPLCTVKNRHMLCCALLVILMLLIAITVYVIFQYLEELGITTMNAKNVMIDLIQHNASLFKEVASVNTTSNHTTL